MDFFATGGFQQLFNDLDDEQQIDFETEIEVEINKIEGYEQTKLMPNDRFLVMEVNGEDDKKNENKNKYNNFYYCHDSDNSIENNRGPFNSLDPVCEDSTIGLERLNGEDYRNFNNQKFKSHKNTKAKSKENTNHPHKKIGEVFYKNDENFQLENCLNFLLPLENDYSIDMSPLMATPVHLIDEVAEWECQFLDNYVEIPELIEILPEKTPLCTDTCEPFLRESLKNLRLAKASKHRDESVQGMTEMNITDEMVELAEDSKVSKPILWNEVDATAGNGACNGYPCTFGNCDKIYAKPAHLKAHLRRHLGEKPYICTWPECTWKFSRSDELARHRRSHSGVKPYKCDYCGKCFARSDHLAKHRKVHERRLLAASKAGRGCDGIDGGGLPLSVFNVRPGRKRKNQMY